MKRKKLVAIFAALMLALNTSIPVFATEGIQMESQINDKVQNEKQAISQEEAQKYADRMIEEMKEGGLYIWNDTTKIDESVPMYDFEGNINSYLFRLKTNGIKQGYIVVNAIKATAGVEICNDTGEYAVDIISKQKIGRPIKKEDSIIRSGTFYFLVEEDAQIYRELATDNVLNVSKQELVSNYDRMIDQRIKNIKLQANANVQSSAPTSYTLPNIDGWKTFTQTENSNICGIIASMNFFYYWSYLHPNKQTSLWTTNDEAYDKLKTFLQYKSTIGVIKKNIMSGLRKYANDRNTTIKGDDSRLDKENIDWAFMKTNIANKNPLVVGTSYPGPNHLMAAFGYQSLSSGTYLVVADGYNSNAKSLLKYVYNDQISFVGYVRF